MPIIKDPAIIERNALLFFGCSNAEAIRLNDGLPLRQQRTKAMRYLNQRGAASIRGVGWEITFPEWLAVWAASGKWDQRGVGRDRYCMARHGDTGPYKVGNVSIQTCVANSRDGIKKAHITLKSSGRRHTPKGTGRGWAYLSGRAKPYQVYVSHKYIGCFATEGEARAAYLAACGAGVQAHG